MIFQIDSGIKNFFSHESGLPLNDVIISSNAWAFRSRIEQKGSLVLPFLNYRILPGQPTLPDRTFPRNYSLTNTGIWMDDLRDRVQCEPFFAKYEATFWSTGFVNSMALFQKFYSKNFEDDRVDYNYIIRSAAGVDTTYQMKATFEFTSLEMDPQWENSADLEKGKIHSVDLSFVIGAFVFQGKNVVPVDEVIMEMFYNNQPYEDTSIPDDATMDKTVTIVVPQS
jgi:hypothetical protein